LSLAVGRVQILDILSERVASPNLISARPGRASRPPPLNATALLLENFALKHALSREY
jgi:hypothetical protein